MKADSVRTIDNLVLASASLRRVELLAQLHIKPAVIYPPDIDETPLPLELPLLYARRIALAKARHVAALMPEKIVLAADTVVFFGRTLLPKAEKEDTARTCLARLSGRRHNVVTAIALAHGGKVFTRNVVSQVRFKRLSLHEIEGYIASREWEGKAGGYAIQGLASGFIPAINGSFSGVVGLPLCETRNLLQSAGIV